MEKNINWVWAWIGVCSFLVISVQISTQRARQDSSSYIAAVVEYPPSYKKDDARSTLRENTEAYVRHIREASKKNADIIVFPEDGLTSVHFPPKSEMDLWTTVIPSVSDHYVPCTDNMPGISETLKRLSCAAKEHAIYVVVNIAEKYYANVECSANETIYYNTNIAFDRAGRIIARYRKTNLFMEPQFSISPSPEIVIFETDFDVKFGMFICFDILFYEPALNLTRDHGITDVVYSTAWFSERPFLTAMQTQFGWAFAENVNLLVAGYNNPHAGSTGSGIFAGRAGIGQAIFSRKLQEKLLVFRVPKHKRKYTSYDANDVEPENRRDTVTQIFGQTFVYNTDDGWKAERSDDLKLLSDNITVYETVSFNESISRDLCHGVFCCTFKVTVTNVDPATRYRIAVFDGVRLYGLHVEAGIRVCALVQCLNDSIASCGSVRNSKTAFTSIEVAGKFVNYKNVLIMPTTLNSSSLRPLQNFNYHERKHDNYLHLTLSLLNETKDIASFGIYSRVFVRDKIHS